MSIDRTTVLYIPDGVGGAGVDGGGGVTNIKKTFKKSSWREWVYPFIVDTCLHAKQILRIGFHH